jgi:hypothetical protein
MTRIRPCRLLLSRVLIAGVCLAPCGFAGLIFEGVAQASGGGFGGNITLLSIQANGTERGCISWNGTTQVIGSAACISGYPPQGGGVSAPPGGDEKTGANQTQIRTIADTGALNANQIRFVFNANEGGGASSAITLADALVAFYAPTGTLLWHSGLSAGGPFTPRTFLDPTGTGTSGQVYRLDFADVQTVQNLVFNRPDYQNVRVGIQFAATQANSGADNFFVTNNAALGFPEVPEPSTWISLASGLLAFFAFWRRRRGAPADG